MTPQYETSLRLMADLLCRHGGNDNGQRFGKIIEDLFAELDATRNSTVSECKMMHADHGRPSDRSPSEANVFKHDPPSPSVRLSTRDQALEEAATICERMVIGGRAWTDDQAVAAGALFAAATEIRAVKKKDPLVIG